MSASSFSRQHSRHAAGEQLHSAGQSGLAWRVVRGSIRLDTTGEAGQALFANLVLPGDILGSESLLLGHYDFTATALTDCELAPWPEGSAVPSGLGLLELFTRAQQRTAELVALRGGQAADRVLGLIRLLCGNRQEDAAVVLPARRDIAEMTDLRLETVSRIIKGLERAGTLVPLHAAGIPVARSFAVHG